MRKFPSYKLLWITALLALGGCGYRAALHPSYLPPEGAAFPGVPAGYGQLAALMEKDTGLAPTVGNTVALLPDGLQKWEVLREDLERAEGAIYIDHYRFCADSLGSVVEEILRQKARQGVDVRWIVPAVNDIEAAKWMGESLYRELTDAGVRIFEWQDEVLHAKQFMTDGALLGIGSANMDNQSFFFIYEVLALVYDEAVTRHAARTFLSELEARCREITPSEIRRWSLLRRLRNSLIRALGGGVG